MKKTFIGKLIGSIIIGISTISLAVASFAWFSMSNGDTEKHIDGEIGLRGYFYTGNGEDTPYEIVSPRHLYNLCRLQNLGLFPTKKNFQIGHKNGSVYEVITGYNNDGTPQWGEVLDMSGTSIKPIGNEAIPFVGNFEGNGIPIANLDVKGNPEDIGFFGYIGHEGSVNGLILQDVDIYSLGYSSSDDDTHDLFDPVIDGDAIDPKVDSLFASSAPYFERFTGVTFVDLALDKETYLTKDNGTNGTVIDNLNYAPNDIIFDKTKAGETVSNTVYNGYFKITVPADHANDDGISIDDKNSINNDPFKYSYRVSSSLLSKETVIDVDGETGNDEALMINISDLIKSGTTSKDFNAVGQNMHVETRLSIYATVEEGGYTYSRVIQSYSINIYSNNDKCSYHCSECDIDYPASALVSGKCPSDSDHTIAPITTYECKECGETYSSSQLIDGKCPTNSGHHLHIIPSYTAEIFCDYVATDSPQHRVTNYHHGNNIGFLAGHLDGSMTNCYVYGSEKENPSDTNYGCNFYLNDDEYTSIETESDIGLIGEIGTNIISAIDPNFGVDGVLDTGVMNFTRIYEGIRSDFANNDVAKAGHSNSPLANYVCYSGKKNTQPTSLFNDYEPYLRHVTVNDKKEYILGADYNIPGGTVVDPGDEQSTWHNHMISSLDSHPELNSVDFLWNQVIQSNEGNHNGLGVFKIATVFNSSASDPEGSDVYLSLGGTRLINGAPKDKVYFSTAEFDHTSDGNNTSEAWSSYQPKRGTTLPSYSNINSFNYQFERDFNYVFELKLSQMNDTNGYNFMSNTQNDFLADYLSYKLINNKADSIPRGDLRFGFMFRASNGVNAYPLTSLSSYLPVGYPKAQSKSNYDGKYYPSDSIVFRIENEHGANVSVVGNKNDITIYKHDPTQSSSNNIKPVYTMKAASAGSDDVDVHRYFEFDVKKIINGIPQYGVTGTETVSFDNDMHDNDDTLYGHIFKLDQGDYVIGSSGDKKVSNIYFLAVQGQENGDIGTNSLDISGNKLENVDFLTEPPTRDSYPAGLATANVNFNANFNTNNDKFTVATKTVDETSYLSFEYSDSREFVTYLSLYYYAEIPKKYYVQGNEKTSSVVYKNH